MLIIESGNYDNNVPCDPDYVYEHVFNSDSACHADFDN